MSEPRRLRTQAERDTDDHTWRQTADTRPGYCTYRETPAGNPSWLLRANPSLGIPVNPEVLAHALDGPLPVDGETCKQWCGYCHLDPGPEPVPAQPPADRSWIEMTLQPRRRWWHRYTRRNP